MTSPSHSDAPDWLISFVERASSKLNDSACSLIDYVEICREADRVANQISSAADGEVLRRFWRIHSEIAHRLGNDGQSYDSLLKASSIEGNGRLVDRASALSALASSAKGLGRVDEAIRALQAAVTKVDVGREMVQLAIAGLLADSGDIAGAIDLLQHIVQSAEEQTVFRVALLQELGGLWERAGDGNKALQNFKGARLLAERLGVEGVLIGSLWNSEAISLMALGLIDEAASAADAAISLCQSGRDWSALAHALSTRGNICIAGGQLDIAIGFYHAALLAEANSDSRKLEPMLLSNIANCYLESGSATLYVRYVLWALDCAEDSGNLYAKALALSSFAQVQSPLESRVLLTEAASLFAVVRDQAGYTSTILRLIVVLRELGEFEDALEFAEELLPGAEVIGDPQLLANTYIERARTLRYLSRIDESRIDFDRAISCMEGARLETLSETIRIAFGEEIRSVADEGLGLALEIYQSADPARGMNWLAWGWHLLECSRGRTLIEIVGSDARLENLVLDRQVQQDLERHVKEIRGLRRELSIARTLANDGLVDQTAAKLRVARGRFAQARSYYSHSSPSFRTLAISAPLGADRVGKMIGEDCVATQFFDFAGTVHSLTVSQDRIELSEHGRLEKLSSLQSSLAEECILSSGSFGTMAYTDALYQSLVGPISARGLFDGVKDWLIIPSGSTLGVPFEALTHSGSILFERLCISYLPAIALAPLLGGVDQFGKCLVFADPDNDLPSARHEATFLSNLADEMVEGSPFLGTMAGKSRLFDLAPQSSIIHIASHAAFEPDVPDFSQIAMAGGGVDSELNLEAREAAELRLRDHLVVLSGCGTGRASTDENSEMFGFVRAFFAAGAAGIVATRWQVRDTSTAEFFMEFYRDLFVQGSHPAAALQQARRLQIEENGYLHPMHWGAFVYWGMPPSISGAL